MLELDRTIAVISLLSLSCILAVLNNEIFEAEIHANVYFLKNHLFRITVIIKQHL